MRTAGGRAPWRAAAWLALLGPLFFASYGAATWLAAQRGDVPAVVYAWESAIPFWPWTIVPYWSIDLLYAVSLFVCASRHELDTHAKRLLTAQVVAVTCFVAFPLRFSFDRPPVAGAFGVLFDVLASFDQPYNQAPSLHIALLVLLWERYAAHLRGGWRTLLHAWFALIGVSVLTTWQHHFVDVPTGALLGCACLWLWPMAGRPPWAAWRRSGDPARRVLARRYALGALALAAGAVAAGGAALWLLWGAVALGIVALAYAGLGVAAFHKHGGRLAPGALALLLPYVAGAWLNARLWTRAHPAPDPVADDVWLGRVPGRGDLDAYGIAAIVDLAAELPLCTRGRAYTAVPMLDLVAPAPEALRAAAAAVEDARRHGRVLVCCALGYSRSAAVVGAWLVATGRARDADEAQRLLARARPRVVLGEGHRRGIAAAKGTAR